ncbi:MAG: hydrolase 76 protein [Icmadophila ericetorum]|nr:hydrolase 76 protein [Icmadophila ericetorum]
MRGVLKGVVLLAGTAWISTTRAIELDIDDPASIKSAASTIAYGLMSYYNGNTTGTVGFFPGYWWEAGAAWGAMIDYWFFTQDPTYNDVVSQALLSQVSPTNDFMPLAVQNQEGNDDQAFWGFAAMSAVERRFPSLPSPAPSWLELAENVFDDMVHRWDNGSLGTPGSCNGGLKWQIFSSNNGYDYKNAPSNGGLFQIAARLARYTGNHTYLNWAETTWDWMSGVGLINSYYQVFDGTGDTTNCTTVDHDQWSYNIGMVMYGAAVLANYTDDPLWRTRTIGLLEWSVNFFSPFPNATAIMYEAQCETNSVCDDDQKSFKAYLARWMAASTQMVPDIQDAVDMLLRPSAQGAARGCSGGSDGVTCSTKWYLDGWDGTWGIGQQLSALEVVQGLLINNTDAPVVLPNVDIVPQTITSTVALSPVTSATAVAISHLPAAAGRRNSARASLALVVGITIATFWLA